MYYFSREDGLKSIPGKTESTEERALLAALCEIYWDTSELKPAKAEQLAVFRHAAHHPRKLVWDWAMIGIALKCRFEDEFRHLFIELLNDREAETRRRMASKVQRLEKSALEVVLPALIGSLDPGLRRTAYRYFTPVSESAADMAERVAMIDEFLKTEADAQNRKELVAAHAGLRESIALARYSRDVFDWPRYEDTLLRAAEAAFNEIGQKHPDVCFRGCMVYCDPGNTSIVLQFERCLEGDEAGSNSDPSEWKFDEFLSTLEADRQFAALWEPIEQEISDKWYDESRPWAANENPERDFWSMARRVAERLRSSKAVTAIKQPQRFQVIAWTEVEPE